MLMRGTVFRAVGISFLMIAGIGFSTTSSAADSPSAAADWHSTVRKFAAEHFKQPAWGYSHSVRDYALARDLAAASSRCSTKILRKCRAGSCRRPGAPGLRNARRSYRSFWPICAASRTIWPRCREGRWYVAPSAIALIATVAFYYAFW